MNAVIDVRDLVKTFGSFRALDGFNLSVEEGTIHGFLGPNGSGKSTTIRILIGVLHATSGTVRVLGGDPRREPALLRRVGYVPGDVAFWSNLTGREVLRALESLRGEKVNRGREEELIERLHLDPDKKTREYSTGNRRKVSLVAALSTEADLLILDEPTAGLDPLMEEVFIEELHNARGRGATVLLSSHIMSEVEKLCDAVTVIKEGRAVESGSVAELRYLSAHEVTAHVSRETTELGGLENASLEEGLFHVTVSRDEVPRVLQLVLDAGGTDITASPTSIEEMFLSHYGADPAAGRGSDR